MAYLRLRDYYTLIQDQQLQAIIRSDDTLRLQAQNTAMTRVKSYMVQKYDTTAEFKDILPYTLARTYKAHDLIELDALPWNVTTAYIATNIVSKNSKVYLSLASSTGSDPEIPSANWKLLGNQYSLYFVPFPYNQFNVTNIYTVGDIVIWRNKVYTCLSSTLIPDHQTILQANTYSNLPQPNVFPDAGAAGLKQWGIGVDYSLSNLDLTLLPTDFTAWSAVTVYTTGSRVSYNSQIWQAIANSTNVKPGADITKWQPISWVSGDDRNASLVEILVDVTLYHLHSAIAPRNIPDLRVKRYDDAIEWLKMCAHGEVTLDTFLLQPKQGNRIRWGGDIKNINSY